MSSSNTAPDSATPEAWTVDELIDRLLVHYGSAWRAKWAGLEPKAVAADWQHTLGRFSRSAIEHGLENLPEFVPTCGQFRNLCLAAPRPRAVEPKALEAPRADPARMVAILARWRDAAAKVRPTDWIAQLEELELAGTLSPGQRHALRSARENLSPAARPVHDENDAARTDELKAAAARRYAEYVRLNPWAGPQA